MRGQRNPCKICQRRTGTEKDETRNSAKNSKNRAEFCPCFVHVFENYDILKLAADYLWWHSCLGAELCLPSGGKRTGSDSYIIDVYIIKVHKVVIHLTAR